MWGKFWFCLRGDFMYQLLIENDGKIYDVTTVLLNDVRLISSIRGEAGSLQFTLYKDDSLQFVEGNRLQFFVDESLVFVGFVVNRYLTSEKMVSVLAYDQIFYLAKNKETYIYWNKTAKNVIENFVTKYSLKAGTLEDMGWIISQRIEEGKSLLDMIFSAIALSYGATGKEFFFYDKAGELTLQSRESLILPIVLKSDEDIAKYTYETDISKDTYNAIKIYQAANSDVEGLVYQAENTDQIKEWGRLQGYEHVTLDLNYIQIQTLGQQFLSQKGRVQKYLTLDIMDAGQWITAGNSFFLEIAELEESSLESKRVLVEKCTHIFSTGEHRMILEIYL